MTLNNSSNERAHLSFRNDEEKCSSNGYQSISQTEDDPSSPGRVHSQSQDRHGIDDHSSHRTLMLGRFMLFFVSFLYGTLNVSLRLVYATTDPPAASALSTVRGWLAAVCFAPFLLQKHHTRQSTQVKIHNSDTLEELAVASDNPHQELPTDQLLTRRPLWLVSLELALLNFGAQALVNISLVFLPSARAAFLTETSVVMTPLLSAAAGYSVRWTVWVGCASAMVGVIILSDTKDGIGNFSVGDLLVLAGAFCWSTYLFRLSQCGASYDEVDLQFWKTVMLAALYTLWFIVAQYMSEESLWAGYNNVVAWLLLFYSALGPGAVADVIQQKAQASIAAAEANVILAMEPVFTSILGFIFLSEALTLTEFLGGSCIIAAAILATR